MQVMFGFFETLLVGFSNGFGVLLLCLDKPLLVYMKCGLLFFLDGYTGENDIL